MTHTGYEPAIQPSVVVRADTSMGLPIKTLHEYGISTVIDFDDRHHPMLGPQCQETPGSVLGSGMQRNGHGSAGYEPVRSVPCDEAGSGGTW